MKLFLFLLFFFPYFIFAQNLELLFSDYIPDIIKNDKENYRQVLETLRRDALLSPDLIYYRLNYYDSRFNKSETDNAKNGFEKIKSLVSQEIDKKNEWLINQIQKAKNYKKRSDFVAEITQYFESLKLDINVDRTFLISSAENEKQKINFFASLYLSEDITLEFDEKIDFAQLRKNLEERKKDELIRLNSDLKLHKSDFSSREVREKVVKFWYLFPLLEATGDRLNAYEILITKLESDYASSKLDKFILLAGGRFYQIKEVSNLVIIPEGTSTELTVAEVYNKYNFVAQFGYRYFISESVHMFSYLNAHVNFALSFSPESELADSIIYIRSEVSGKDFTSELWDLNQREISNAAIISFYLRLSSPIFILGNNFSVDIGFMAGFSQLNCDFSYSYNYQKVKVDWDEINGGYHNTLLARFNVEDLSESVTITTFRIYPSVDFNFHPFQPIFLQLSTGYNLVELKAGMTF